MRKGRARWMPRKDGLQTASTCAFARRVPTVVGPEGGKSSRHAPRSSTHFSSCDRRATAAETTLSCPRSIHVMYPSTFNNNIKQYVLYLEISNVRCLEHTVFTRIAVSRHSRSAKGAVVRVVCGYVCVLDTTDFTDFTSEFCRLRREEAPGDPSDSTARILHIYIFVCVCSNTTTILPAH